MRDARPELLSSPNIPKPLHGLNPRTIMGQSSWDSVRHDVYAYTGYRCAACGVHKRDAKLHQWLEAHEIFNIDYKNGVATMVEIVPLCHFCHSFIHSGLLRMKARKKEVGVSHVRSVMQHGVNMLKISKTTIFRGTADLCDLVSIDIHGITVMGEPRKVASWGKWIMRWGENEYKGRFKSINEWSRHYGSM